MRKRHQAYLFVLLALTVLVAACGINSGKSKECPTETSQANVSPFVDASEQETPTVLNDAGSYSGIKVNLDATFDLPEPGCSALGSLLDLVPANYAMIHSIYMFDVSMWRAQFGVDPPDYSEGPTAAYDQFVELYEQRGVENWREFPPDPEYAPFISGFGQYGQAVTFDSMGFDQRNVDQIISLTTGWGRLDIIVGRFDPEFSARLLEACQCPQPEVLSYGGFEWWAWNDRGEGSLDRSFAAPVFDRFGVGGHILMTKNVLYRAETEKTMRLLIDMLRGSQKSIGNSVTISPVLFPDYKPLTFRSEDARFILDALTQMNVNEIRMGLGTGGDENSENRPPGPDNDRYMYTKLINQVSIMGVGKGWDGEKQFIGAVLAHDDAVMAKENVEKVLFRLLEGRRSGSVPWNDAINGIDIGIHDRYMLVRISLRSLEWHAWNNEERHLMDDVEGLLFREDYTVR
jgi:hypothetical protein